MTTPEVPVTSPARGPDILLRAAWAMLPLLAAMHLLGWWIGGTFRRDTYNLLLDRFNLHVERTPLTA